MNQFTVPQFIDVEDKIFGPVTTRQFIILLAASLILFVAYRLADTSLFIFLILLIGGLALIFAFVKINGQKFHYFVLNIIQTVRRPSRRLWFKGYTNKELNYLRKRDFAEAEKKEPAAKRAAASRIRDLSLLVNTGGYYRPES